jgi:hypothetical protein
MNNKSTEFWIFFILRKARVLDFAVLLNLALFLGKSCDLATDVA